MSQLQIAAGAILRRVWTEAMMAHHEAHVAGMEDPAKGLCEGGVDDPRNVLQGKFSPSLLQAGVGSGMIGVDNLDGDAHPHRWSRRILRVAKVNEKLQMYLTAFPAALEATSSALQAF